jgi:hypothetical protein
MPKPRETHPLELPSVGMLPVQFHVQFTYFTHDHEALITGMTGVYYLVGTDNLLHDS